MTRTRLLVFPRVIIQDFFYPLFFLYCVTLHADQLGFSLLNFKIRLNNLVALLLLVYLLSRYRNKFIFVDRSLICSVGLLFASMFFSFLLSPYKTRCFFFFGLFGLTTLCYVFLPYWLVLRFDADKLMKMYLASFLIVGSYALCQLLLCLVGIHDPFVQQWISGTLYRPNAFAYEPSFYALYFTPLVVIVNLHYVLNNKNFPWMAFPLKRRHVLFVNALFLVSTSTSCYFAYATFALILGILSLIPSIRRSFPTLVKGGTKFVGGIFLFSLFLSVVFRKVMSLFFLKFFFAGFSHHSVVERWSGIINGINLFLTHPFFGIGMGGYPSFMMNAYLNERTDYIFIYQEKLLPFAANPIKLFEPSNIFTEVLASLGVFGLIALTGFIVSLVSKGIKAIKQNHTQKETLFVLLVSVLVLAIVLQINQGLFRTYVWAHYAFVYGYCTKKLFRQAPAQ
ncbi:MAG: O-antigen ligase family protein [Chlamydiia bacterium]|nr:O-antigen ligase family protein [Chlamydiia bacterium]